MGTQVCMYVCCQYVILGAELGTVVFLTPFLTRITLPTIPTIQKRCNVFFPSVLSRSCKSDIFQWLKKAMPLGEEPRNNGWPSTPNLCFLVVSTPGAHSVGTWGQMRRGAIELSFLPKHTGKILFCAKLYLNPNIFLLRTDENNNFVLWRRREVTKG